MYPKTALNPSGADDVFTAFYEDGDEIGEVNLTEIFRLIIDPAVPTVELQRGSLASRFIVQGKTSAPKSPGSVPPLMISPGSAPGSIGSREPRGTPAPGPEAPSLPSSPSVSSVGQSSQDFTQDHGSWRPSIGGRAQPSSSSTSDDRPRQGYSQPKRKAASSTNQS